MSPSSVTLAGISSSLESAGDFLFTAPISLTNVLNEITIDTPLLIPEGASALDELGENVNSVSVYVRVAPITDYLALNSMVNVLNLEDLLIAKVTPNQISVLAIGPQPLLDAIREDPNLIIVFLDLSDYTEGVFDVPLQVQAPIGIQVQMFPSDVEVVIKSQQPAAE